MKNTLGGVALAAVASCAIGASGGISDARRGECAARARELVAKMTPEERLGQLMMDSPAIERLGIKPYHWWNEALHGVARAGEATVFPQSMALAATFDSGLVRRVADVISTEGRAKYNVFASRGRRGIYCGLTFWSPNVNLFRDPRWGRGQETFGEDPWLTSEMGCAFVRGLQGDDPAYLKTAACAKHFAVHSGPENLRLEFDARATDRDLAEYYLQAFRSLVEDAHVESVMGAYSAVRGVPCCASRWLLTDVLRGEWGFKGHIVSDVGAVRYIDLGHHWRDSQAEASLAALDAGLDLCSDGTYNHLLPLLKDGTLDPARLERPLVNLLTTRMLLGQFDPPGSTPWDSLGAADVATPENRALALEAAEKSLVLVHNNGALPADPAKMRGILVEGSLSTDEMTLLGNYSGTSSDPVTCLTGFMREIDSVCPVTNEGSSDADLIVYCCGITARDEGEQGCSGGDRVRYSLPERQLEELRSLNSRRRGRKLVAVVFGCSPLDLAPLSELCDAVIVAWYPGEQGGRAIARAILGRVNPSGRLPITYPKSYDDLPPIESYALKGRTYRYADKEPLYPFGYGLSYTKFRYGDLKVEKSGEEVKVEAKVANAGDMAGDEVVQLYLRAPQGSGDRRVHHLEGAARVSIEPGETKTVSFRLKKKQFMQFGEDGVMTLAKGDHVVFVGGGQPGFADNAVSAKVSFDAPAAK